MKFKSLLFRLFFHAGIVTGFVILLLGYQNFSFIHFVGSADMQVAFEKKYYFTAAWSNEGPATAANVIDDKGTTAYESNVFLSAANDRGALLMVSFDLTQGLLPLSHVVMRAHVANGRVVGFPQSYAIYVTSKDGSAWVYAGTFTTQPDQYGTAVVALGAVYQTSSVAIIPLTLGRDELGSYRFQLAEVLPLILQEVPKTMTMTAPQMITSGDYTLAMQTDGNFVVYKNFSQSTQSVVWHTQTYGHTCNKCTATLITANGTVVLAQGEIPYWTGQLFHGGSASVSEASPTAAPVTEAWSGGEGSGGG